MFSFLYSRLNVLFTRAKKEIHLYTSIRVIGESKLDNPLTIDEDWELLTEKTFENDVLKVLRKKELCLQEL